MRSPASQRLHTRHSGFTLLELIIALSLTVLITLAVFGGLQLAVRAADKGSEQTERTNEMRVVRDWIRRQIERAQPIMVKQESGKPVAAFWGDPYRVRFVAPLPAHLGGGGLSWVTLQVNEDQSELRLVVDYQLYHPDVTEETHRPKRKLLLDAISDARFRFYGAIDEDDAPMWHDHWSQIEFLPSLISLEIVFEERQRKEWITLIAAPVIDGKSKRGTVLVNERSHETTGA